MTLPTRRDRFGRPTRRQLLQIGALEALCDPPGLLWASSPYGADAGRSGPERSCIFIVQGNGPAKHVTGRVRTQRGVAR